MEIYDLLILGAGPAGLTAAIYALRYNLKLTVIGGIAGGLMTESHKICNWPGEPGITGAELSKKFADHVTGMGAEIVADQINKIERQGQNWLVSTAGGRQFVGKTVLYTLGTSHRKLGLADEAKFLGRGVAYCATCDGMFFKGKTTAVIGGGNSAMTAALYLADICPQVYLIYRGTELKGETAWLNEVLRNDKIIKISQTNISGLAGENKLEKIILDKPFNGQGELAVEGLFVEIGLLPKTELFKALGGEVNDFGYIKVGADQATNLPGLWAAGDATNASNGFRQIVTATSEGAIAADSIFKYLKVNKTN